MKVDAKHLVSCAAVLASGLTTSCETCESVVAFFREPAPDIDAPNRFSGGPLSFSYPGNWTVRDETLNPAGVAVTVVHVESPGSAYLGVQLYTPGLERTVDEIFDDFCRELPGQVDQISAGIVGSELGESSAFEREFLGVVRSARRRSVVLTVIGERVAHTAEGYVAHRGDHTVVVFTMVADEDRERVTPGFGLVLDTIDVASGGG